VGQEAKMKALKAGFLWAVLVAGLAGCVAQPKIDTAGLAPPKSVAIVDIPKMANMALIGVVVPYAPGPNQFHFSQRGDSFFEVAGQPKLAIGTPGNTYGLIGFMIESNAADTQKKAEAEFNSEILKRFPDFDLRADFMRSLRASLKARGVAVTMLNSPSNQAPRLLWPAADKEGYKYPSGTLDSTAAVDADIVMQVSPIAIFNSPGPLNAYKRNVSVGVALYNGRTKQFIGRQTIFFRAPDARFEYYRYDLLVQDLSQAAPALRDALLSLVPAVANTVASRK
jgi:hypothetical protein